MRFPLIHKIGRYPIKESLDNLPSGVCFASSNGMIVLCNYKMDLLYRQLAGNDLQHLAELRHALCSPVPEVSVLDADQFLYRLPDGTVWQFSEQPITDKSGTGYTQFLAIDVTALYDAQTALRRENDVLMAASARAAKLYAELDKLVRDEESFAIKTRLHDGIGLALLQSRQLLKKDASLEELHQMGGEWSRIVSTIGVSQEADTLFSGSIAEELADLKALIRGIGVTLQVQGELPHTKAAANLLSATARECAINTVRHAEGDVLTIVLSHAGGHITAEITNNGQLPQQTVVEGGGLSALRKRVETVGGAMTVSSSPAFMLKITLPDEEVLP